MPSGNLPAIWMSGLRDSFKLVRFIETGSCYGGTTAVAASLFPQVDTVEIMPHRYEHVVRLFKGKPRVRCHYGDSRDFLKSFDWPNMSPTLVYLDAHWPEGIQPREYVPGFEDPLVAELTAIKSLYGKHCIVIDDFAPHELPTFTLDGEYSIFGPPDGTSFKFAVLAPGPCDWEGWVT